jgi:hypothetical protein
MRTFVRLAVVLIAATAMCQASLALAENYYGVSGDNKAASPAGNQKASPQSPCCVEDSQCAGQCSGCEGCLCQAMEPCRVWYVDYRLQQMFNSHTTYQFGTAPQLGGPQYAPISKLAWSLNSTWTGLRAGVQKPNLDIHFEWLTAIGIDGNMEDSDWQRGADPTLLTSLSRSPEKWNDGQKIELEADYKWTDCFLGMPIEFWPLAGFRFQRFDLTAHDGDQIVSVSPEQTIPVGYHWTGIEGTFNQQYYIGYIGGQFRASIERECRPPITVTFQADYGATSGYNVDHHISGYEAAGSHRYTMESTSGGALHLALIADAPFNCHTSIGLQFDYTDIYTTGTHHWLQYGGTTYAPRDETWSNGVVVNSDQMSLTAYLRYCW